MRARAGGPDERATALAFPLRDAFGLASSMAA